MPHLSAPLHLCFPDGICAHVLVYAARLSQGAQMAPPAKNEYDHDAFDRIGGDAPDGLDDELTTQRLLLERMIESQKNTGNEPPNWQ